MKMFHEYRNGKGYTLLVKRLKNNVNGNPRFSVRVYERAENSEYSFELSSVIASAKLSKQDGYVLSRYQNEYMLANSVLDDVLKKVKMLENA